MFAHPPVSPRVALNSTRRLVGYGVTLLSFLLFALSVTIWFASHWRGAYLGVRGDFDYSLSISCGQLRLDVDASYVTPIAHRGDFRNDPSVGPERLDPYHEKLGRWRSFGVNANPRPLSLPHKHLLGFWFSSGQSIWGSIPWTDAMLCELSAASGRTLDTIPSLREGPTLRVRGVHTEAYAPLWFFPMIFSLPAVTWVVGRLRARRRFMPGCCPQCGYDLHATPGHCPECGGGYDVHDVPRPA